MNREWNPEDIQRLYNYLMNGTTETESIEDATK